ncbi:MAG TPA: hypothetical protein PKD54_11945, partial [Pirellulaceae bacterium]|nr:hypothetical protein [Pirellulaceae bacterium]
MQASPHHSQVTLFPFLTVLLATMGILVVMLVLAVHAASIKSAAAEPPDRELYADQLIALQDDIDLQIIRRDALQRARPGLVEQLHSARMVRANIQSALIELEREEALLARQFETLEARETDGLASIDSSQALEEQRRAWLQRIELARSRLAELQRHQSNTPTKLYSIVPTRQADGTNRRPIYVECVAEGLILQPYGIQIKTVELPVPGLPGNPLDAGLSTIREYWQRNGGETTEGHPYPLLVVRPSGAGTYGLARRALGSWTDEFGYELVDQDLALDFGVVDSSLRQSIELAVHRAKREQIAHARLLEELARQQSVQREGARSEQFQGLQADRIHGGFVRTGGGTEPSERQSGVTTHSASSQLIQSPTTAQN